MPPAHMLGAAVPLAKHVVAASGRLGRSLAGCTGRPAGKGRLEELLDVLLAWIFYLAASYLVAALILTYAVQRLPRNPVTDPPDWGTVEDRWIPAADDGQLEVWRIVPERPNGHVVLFAHGWGRNRDRMVVRARIFARWGYTTVIHSARDHGRSSRLWFVNTYRFAEDIEAVMDWLDEPVLLYGHSAGSGGAIIAAIRNPDRVRLLFLEASYPDTRKALVRLYTWVNPWFGRVFGSAIVNCMNFFYRGGPDHSSPARLASHVKMPVLVIHGAADRRFPVHYAKALHAAFPPGQAELFIAPGAAHSTSSRTPEYLSAVAGFLQSNGFSARNEETLPC